MWVGQELEGALGRWPVPGPGETISGRKWRVLEEGHLQMTSDLHTHTDSHNRRDVNEMTEVETKISKFNTEKTEGI